MASFTRYTITALLFILPQVLVTLLFFIWPACSAVFQSLFYSDAFGLHRQFAGLENFLDLFHDPSYGKALWVTLVLAMSITSLTMILGLSMAVLVNAQGSKTQGVYKTLLIWPYAVAPAVSAILWRFLCLPWSLFLCLWLSSF